MMATSRAIIMMNARTMIGGSCCSGGEVPESALAISGMVNEPTTAARDASRLPAAGQAEAHRR